MRVGGRATGRSRPDFNHEARGRAGRNLMREVAGTPEIQYDPRAPLLPLRDADPAQQVPCKGECLLHLLPRRCPLVAVALLQIEVDSIGVAELPRPNQVCRLQVERHTGGILFGGILNGSNGGESRRYDVWSFRLHARCVGGCEQVTAHTCEL